MCVCHMNIEYPCVVLSSVRSWFHLLACVLVCFLHVLTRCFFCLTMVVCCSFVFFWLSQIAVLITMRESLWVGAQHRAFTLCLLQAMFVCVLREFASMRGVCAKLRHTEKKGGGKSEIFEEE